MLMKDKGPKLLKIESPGGGFCEQVEYNDTVLYAVYTPKQMVFDTESEEGKAEAKKYFEGGLYETENMIPEKIAFHSTILKEQTEEYTIYHVPLVKCPWPLPGEPIEPDADLWLDIHGYVYRHCDLPDERLYDVATAWIMATWIPEAWISVPYLQILGPKNSGKTRLLEILNVLCYRGLLSPSISEAALFRGVEAFHPTLLLDEAEIYSDKNREAIQNLLNAGYRRGQYVIRMVGMDGGNPRLGLFEVFGFKALAGTGTFKDTLESRAILINMEKNVRPVENFLDNETAKQLRSKLLWWRFRRLSDVSDVSDVSSDRVSKELSYADGRFIELYTPLLLVSNEGSKNILSYAKDAYKQTLDEEKASVEAQIILSVIKCYPKLENSKIPVSVLTENYNSGLSDRERRGTRWMGRKMKALGFRPTRLTGGARAYLWEQNRMERLCKRYGCMSEISSLTSLTSLIEDPSLKEQLDTLCETLSDIQLNEAHGPIAHNTLRNRLGWGEVHFDRVLSIAIRDKVVYEARPGFIGVG